MTIPRPQFSPSWWCHTWQYLKFIGDALYAVELVLDPIPIEEPGRYVDRLTKLCPKIHAVAYTYASTYAKAQ